MIVLDTNVLSETLRPAPSAAVLEWLSGQDPESVFLTTITQAELLYGIELLPAGKRKMHLHRAVEELLAEDFAGRILPFDESAARLFGPIAAHRAKLGRPISQPDAMIAAIARSRRSAVATRNTADFAHCGIRLIDPWAE